MRRIVLPTDFSACAERALPRALALAEQFGAEIHLVHVLPTLHTGDDPDDETHTWREESARTRLEATRMAYRYGLPGTHAARMELVVVREGQPAEAISRYARSNDADLIVMGTHGRSFRRNTTMGSTTAAVLRYAPCPVMTVSAFRQSTGMIRQVLAVVAEDEMTPTVLHYATNLAAAFDAQLTVLESSHDACGWPAVPLAAALPHLATQIDADLIVLPACLTDSRGTDQAYRIVRSVAGSVLTLKSPSATVDEGTAPCPRRRPKPSLPART